MEEEELKGRDSEDYEVEVEDDHYVIVPSDDDDDDETLDPLNVS